PRRVRGPGRAAPARPPARRWRGCSASPTTREGPRLPAGRLAALGLRPGWRVVDVASGPGATARLLAAEYAVTVDGVELGGPAVERARSATDQAGLPGSIRFHRGDAERLPLPAPTADAAPRACAFF